MKNKESIDNSIQLQKKSSNQKNRRLEEIKKNIGNKRERENLYKGKKDKKWSKSSQKKFNEKKKILW